MNQYMPIILIYIFKCFFESDLKVFFFSEIWVWWLKIFKICELIFWISVLFALGFIYGFIHNYVSIQYSHVFSYPIGTKSSLVCKDMQNMVWISNIFSRFWCLYNSIIVKTPLHGVDRWYTLLIHLFEQVLKTKSISYKLSPRMELPSILLVLRPLTYRSRRQQQQRSYFNLTFCSFISSINQGNESQLSHARQILPQNFYDKNLH